MRNGYAAFLGKRGPESMGPLPCAGILAKSLLAAQPRFAALARVTGSVKTPNADRWREATQSRWMRPR